MNFNTNIHIHWDSISLNEFKQFLEEYNITLDKMYRDVHLTAKDKYTKEEYDIKGMTGTFLYLNEDTDKKFKLGGVDPRAVIFRKYNESGQAILDIPLYNSAIEYTVK